MADPFKDGSGNFTYGYITDAANVLEDDGLITSSATESLDYGLVADAILYSVQLSGIELASAVGNISENVADTIQISGIEATSTAQSIAASGTQTISTSITGIELSSEYGSITAIADDFIVITGLDAQISVENITASGIQSPSIALNGIDLTAEYGLIYEEVVDTIALNGIDLGIIAENISANGVSNPVISLNGIGLQARVATITATGADIVPEEFMGGRYTTQKNEINATAQVQTARAIAFAGRVTPRGFTVINGGARVFSIQTEAHINEATASGQLGIDDESLLMLLVA